MLVEFDQRRACLSLILIASVMVVTPAGGTDIQDAHLVDGFSQDVLSEGDKLIYRSHGPSFWRASDQGTLRQVLLVHRHGDRTPFQFHPEDPIGKEAFWTFHGLTQLTNRGKARLYMLGKIMRQRYNVFLGGSVSKSQVKTRSSGSQRCIESAQAFLASFLALDMDRSLDAARLRWDEPSNRLAQRWQPASIQTLAAKMDGMLNVGARCRSLRDEIERIDESEDNRQLSEEFKHEMEVVNREFRFNIDRYDKWLWTESKLEVVQSYFGPKLSPALLAAYHRISQASFQAARMHQASPKVRRLGAGLLINDLLANMEAIRAANKSPSAKKFVHYSAHDTTIIYLLGLLENLDHFPHMPDYGSNIAFELHEEQGEWFIKIYYMPHVPSKPVRIHLNACEGHPKSRCTLDKFAELMQKYRIASWADWMQECGNPLDSVNPYEQIS